MNRRSFLAMGAAGAVGLLRGTRRVFAQQDEIPYGETRMALSDDDRQGSVYVPKAYKQGSPRPMLLMLHGFSGTSDRARSMQPLAEERGIILVAPESREITWGQSAPGFDQDSAYINQAIRAVSGYLDIDKTRVGLGGQSDGATYAFSMGLAFGDVFTHLMIFAEGIPIPYRKRGRPKIFIGHGVNDTQMPIDRTSRRFVPQLREEGYDITYREHEGGHGTPIAIVREGFDWFGGGPAPKP
jgi:predicted esterase